MILSVDKRTASSYGLRSGGLSQCHFLVVNVSVNMKEDICLADGMNKDQISNMEVIEKALIFILIVT